MTQPPEHLSASCAPLAGWCPGRSFPANSKAGVVAALDSEWLKARNFLRGTDTCGTSSSATDLDASCNACGHGAFRDAVVRDLWSPGLSERDWCLLWPGGRVRWCRHPGVTGIRKGLCCSQDAVSVGVQLAANWSCPPTVPDLLHNERMQSPPPALYFLLRNLVKSATPCVGTTGMGSTALLQSR